MDAEKLSELQARIADVSLDEKAAITAGYDVWTVPGVDALGIPPLRMTDGPNGARGAMGPGTPDGVRSVCVPTGSALAATFDADLLHRIGDMLGREARQKRARVLLAPTINLVRSPLYGRSFECYGEDPWLSGTLAAAFISGVQAQGVATTPKHFVGNETEFQRTTINSVMDERTLREVYLLPFEFAIRHGGSLGIMTAYNRLNGQYCTESPALLNGILRDEWGFEGFVVSDWFAGGSTVGALEAGLDVQMPGPDRFFGKPVAEAIRNGDTAEAALDALVRRRLHVHHKLDAWNNDVDEPEQGEEGDVDRALAHEAATAAITLLENDGLLPLSPDISSLAVIGPNATTAHIMGGGSSQLIAHRRVAPARVFEERLGERVRVEQGCVIDKNARPVRPQGGFAIDYFTNEDWSGDPVIQTTQASGRAILFEAPDEGMGHQAFTARMTGTVNPTVSGEHTFTLIQIGPARVLLDGKVIIDGIAEKPERGDSFFSLGSVEMRATVDLTAGEPVDLVVEFSGRAGAGVKGVSVGHTPPIPTDLLDRAVAAATEAEAAVVIVGTSSEWESEGADRTVMELPGEQKQLIEAVCAANPKTCVVVNAGSAVDLSWADKPAAVVYGWLGGQEMAHALAEVIFGDAEPGGRLPITMPLSIGHTPPFGNFPGESNTTNYAEGLLVGHRWYDSRGLDVAYPFGFGRSYTSFDWSEPTVHSTGSATCAVDLTVTNTGDRAGSDVVQVYLSAPESAFSRPRRELVGVAKVHLAAGESTAVQIALPKRAFAYWNPANHDHIEARKSLAGSDGGVPTLADSEVPADAGWYIGAGDYELHVSRSIADTHATATFTVGTAEGPLTGPDSLP